MLKKSIDAFIALRYILVEFGLCVTILLCSFIYGRTGADWLRYVLMVGSFGIVVIIALYFKDKAHVKKKMAEIKKKSDYDRSIIFGSVFFLENRFLAYARGDIFESDYKNLTDAQLITGKRGKQAVVLTVDGRQYEAQVSTPQQAERLAAFLRVKNPEIALHGLKTKGNGAFRAIDLVPAEKQSLS